MREEELSARIHALQALVTAPFIIFIVVLIVSTLAILAYIERTTRS